MKIIITESQTRSIINELFDSNLVYDVKLISKKEFPSNYGNSTDEYSYIFITKDKLKYRVLLIIREDGYAKMDFDVVGSGIFSAIELINKYDSINVFNTLKSIIEQHKNEINKLIIHSTEDRNKFYKKLLGYMGIKYNESNYGRTITAFLNTKESNTLQEQLNRKKNNDYDDGIIMEMKLLNVINELFSEKLQQSLIQKFQTEVPNLEERTVRYYIDRFDQLRNSSKIQQKDITKYSWKELETIVDVNQPKSYDKHIKISDSDLIYNQNNLQIYRANSKKACVHYGNGYNFCISARGEGNMYDYYRFKANYTIYFVFDKDATTEMINDKFIDPYHLIILMVRKGSQDYRKRYDQYGQLMQSDDIRPAYDHIGRPLKITDLYNYKITSANNDDEQDVDFQEIVDIQPKLANLKEILAPVEPDIIENQIFFLKNMFKERLQYIYDNYFSVYHYVGDEYPTDTTERKEYKKRSDIATFGRIYSVDELKHVEDILNGKEPIRFLVAYDEKGHVLYTQRQDKDIDTTEWLDIQKQKEDNPEDFKYAKKYEYYISDTFDEYKKYLKSVHETILKYLNETNKLNYQQQ